MKALQWLLHWLHIFFFSNFQTKKLFFLLFGGGKSYHDIIICTFFWENSQSEIEARRVSWSLFLYILQALECFTLYSKAFFLHYMLLFFNFWVKIRPMFVKIWFRININWHNLVKSAMKKILLFAPLSDHDVRCSLFECLLYGCSIQSWN